MLNFSYMNNENYKRKEFDASCAWHHLLKAPKQIISFTIWKKQKLFHQNVFLFQCVSQKSLKLEIVTDETDEITSQTTLLFVLP